MSANTCPGSEQRSLSLCLNIETLTLTSALKLFFRSKHGQDVVERALGLKWRDCLVLEIQAKCILDVDFRVD